MFIVNLVQRAFRCLFPSGISWWLQKYGRKIVIISSLISIHVTMADMITESDLMLVDGCGGDEIVKISKDKNRLIL